MQQSKSSTLKFGEKEYLSYSSLKQALRSPQHFLDYVEGRTKTTDAMVFGSAYDAMLFDKANWDNQFFVAKESEIIEKLLAGGAKVPRATKEYKEYMATQEAQAGSRDVITEAEYSQMAAMYEVLKATGVEKDYFIGGQQIKSSALLDGTHPIKIHGVADIFFPFQKVVRDFKTTGEELSRFKYSARKFHYDLQAYVYKILFGYSEYQFVVQETNYPYNVGVFDVTDEFLLYGKEKFDKALATVIHYFVEKNAEPSSYIYRETL